MIAAEKVVLEIVAGPLAHVAPPICSVAGRAAEHIAGRVLDPAWNVFAFVDSDEREVVAEGGEAAHHDESRVEDVTPLDIAGPRAAVLRRNRIAVCRGARAALRLQLAAVLEEGRELVRLVQPIREFVRA